MLRWAQVRKGAPIYQRPSSIAQQMAGFSIFYFNASCGLADYSTVTDFARLRGLSTSVPRARAVW